MEYPLALSDKRLAREVFRLANKGSLALRSTLLKATIAFANTTSFYRKLWQEIELARIDVGSLDVLPIVTRSMINAAGDAARAFDEDVVCNEVFTMGTTGPPLITLRGDKEQRFIGEYFALLKNQRQGKISRGLKFIDPYHGYHIRVPVAIHFHNVSVYDAGSFDYAREVLAKHYREKNIEGRCTILLGGGRCLRAFTLDTANRYGQISSTLERIITLGEYLPSRWRRLLEETWRTPIIDRYSLSEIFGGATQSLACGWWHFDPYVIPEVVDLQRERNIAEGIGILVLTALVPFQQVQPLVRYFTGDLVEVTHSKSSTPGCLAIRPLGRVQQAVISRDGSSCLITPVSLFDILDAMPEVARSPLLRDSRQVKDSFAIGLPRFAIEKWNEHERLFVCLHVAVYDIERVEAGGLRLREEIVRRLLDANPNLARAKERGEVVLTVVFDDQVEGCDISAPG